MGNQHFNRKIVCKLSICHSYVSLLEDKYGGSQNPNTPKPLVSLLKMTHK